MGCGIKLGAEYPEYKDWVESVVNRVVDLIVPFRQFYYYNPKQKGSASLKAVLPALVGKDYSELEISDGGTASILFLEMMHGGKDVRSDLLKYCCLDTEGMEWIVGKLKDLI